MKKLGKQEEKMHEDVTAVKRGIKLVEGPKERTKKK